MSPENPKQIASLESIGGADTVSVHGADMAAKKAFQEAIEDAVKTVAVEAEREKMGKVKKGDKATRLVEAEMEEAGIEPVYVSYEESLKIKPHAFVIMPFGKKKGIDGQILDFNAIYAQLIKPALIEAGFEPFRADEETISGDILTDMFQELLLADLALCDMSIDNANVFYELGIRHAFRKRGVVHIQSGRAYMPFDIFNVRTIPYHTTEEGVPDPDYLEKDIQAIARVARDTWTSEQEAIHSPVFNLLTGLDEPERRTLRTPLATGFWREYNEWRQRITVAQRQKRIGDILLLTEEITNPLIKEEAHGEAGKALHAMDRNELALQQYRQGLQINSQNQHFRREEAFHLNRLGRVDEAIVKLESLLAEHPDDSEAVAYLGRIYKDMWMDTWLWIDEKEKRMVSAFEAYHWLVKAINTYLEGYRQDLNNYYPGVNALTLATILVHLADLYDDKEDPDPDITAIRELLHTLQDTLTFALENLVMDAKTDYWTLASLADLRVAREDNIRRVVRAYRKAFTAARKNLFYLRSARQQLEILLSLGLCEEHVQAGIDAIDEEVRRITKQEEPEKGKEEKQVKVGEENVFLFSGYMLDHPGHSAKRLPPNQVEKVKEAINNALVKHNGDRCDIAFVGGMACGAEILFVEACVERSIHVEVHLPEPEAIYISKFVGVAGDEWIERFYRLRNHPLVSVRQQTDHVGKAKPGIDIYERNNRWTLYSSMLLGIDKVRMIVLWDGKTERPKDMNGRLVLHMVEQMRELGGRIEHVNSSAFAPMSAIKENIFEQLRELEAAESSAAKTGNKK